MTSSIDRLPEALEREVRAWIADDPDPETRTELESLLERNDRDALAARFAGTLEFGTAGLRGAMGGGPLRMNRRMVIRATVGVAEHLESDVDHAKERGVVVACDSRRRSRDFADDVTSVLAARGFVVHRFDEPSPTPLAAFAARDLGAAAACVVTASHNPPGDNGLKIYWANGAQIVPPHDVAIAQAMTRVDTVSAVPRLGLDEARSRGLVRSIDGAMVEGYRAGVRALFDRARASAPLRIAYTALHGVGESLARSLLHDAGFDDVHSVASQAEPDGTFPTVASPNPEEPDAMSEVLALADRVQADLVLANDPDADRLAVAVRHGGRLVTLDGNAIGCFLADALLARTHAARPLVLSTIVSSPFLGAIAASHGARWERTLTGHKWIHTRAMALEREGYETIFGYEEALGFAVGTLVRDKDGLSAAVAIAIAASGAKARGATLVDELDRLARAHGVFRSRQRTRTHTEPGGRGTLDALVARFRNGPPKTLGGFLVTAREDFASGIRTDARGATTALSLPTSNVLSFELEGGHRVMIRPSGTEPKLKVYLDARAAVGPDGDVSKAAAAAEAILDALAADIESRLD